MSAWISAFAAERAGLRTVGSSAVRRSAVTAWLGAVSRGTARRSTGAMVGEPSGGVAGSGAGSGCVATGACW